MKNPLVYALLLVAAFAGGPALGQDKQPASHQASAAKDQHNAYGEQLGTELLQFGTQCANLRTENHQTATICGWLHLQPRQRGDPVDDPPHSGTSRLGPAWNVAHRDESARGTVTAVVFRGSHPCLSQGASMDSSSNRYFCGYKLRAPNSR